MSIRHSKKSIVSLFLTSLLSFMLVLGSVIATGAEKTITITSPETPYSYDTVGKIVDAGDTWSAFNIYLNSLFMKLYNVKVIGESWSIWSPGANERIMAALAGGGGPAYYPASKFGGVPSAISQGLCADVTEYVQNWDQSKYIPKGLWASSWKDGRCYAIPKAESHSSVIVFRKDWLKEKGIFNKKGEPVPPENWTWTDFAEIAKKITNSKKKQWGFSLEAGEECAETGSFYDMVASTYGVPLVKPDPTGKYTWRAAFNTPESAKVLQFYKDLTWKDKCVLTGVEQNWLSSYNDFVGGRIGMRTGSDMHLTLRAIGRPQQYGKDMPPAVEVSGIAPFPTPSENGKLVDTEIGVLWLINPMLSKTEKKAALDWLNFSQCGKGRELTAFYSYQAGGGLPWGYGFSPYKEPAVAGELLGSLYDHIPGDFAKTIKKLKGLPVEPKPVGYGLSQEKESLFMNTLTSCVQSAVTDPNCDVQEVLNKAAGIANSTALDYKIKGQTMENFKEYYTALDEFYKKDFPNYYKNVFLKLYEKYYKVW